MKVKYEGWPSQPLGIGTKWADLDVRKATVQGIVCLHEI